MRTETLAPPLLTEPHAEKKARLSGAARWLAAGGGLAVVAAVVLPWVTVRARVPVDLELLSVEVPAGEHTVAGIDTMVWPGLAALAILAVTAAALRRGRRLFVGLGLLFAAAGAGLLYYLANIIDIKTRDSSVLERTAADLLIGTSVGPGPYVIMGGGAALAIAGLLRRR